MLQFDARRLAGPVTVTSTVSVSPNRAPSGVASRHSSRRGVLASTGERIGAQMRAVSPGARAGTAITARVPSTAPPRRISRVPCGQDVLPLFLTAHTLAKGWLLGTGVPSGTVTSRT